MDYIGYTGIWLQPVTLYGLYRIWQFTSGVPWSATDWGTVFALSFLPPMYAYSINMPKRRAGKKHFSLISGFEMDMAIDTYKWKAQRPEPNPRLISKVPTGIIWGKYCSKYIVEKIDRDAIYHHLIIGGSGSGKTSGPIITTLLSIFENMAQPASAFIVDVKGDISAHTARDGDQNVTVFAIEDREHYGYDPFFKIDETSTSQEILETVEDIAQSLFPPAIRESSDSYWTNSARDMFSGLVLYQIKERHCSNFIDVLDAILSRPVTDQVNEVLTACLPSTPEFRYLVQFAEMAASKDNETIACVSSSMSVVLTPYINDANIRYALRDNPLKMNPQMLDDIGRKIYLRVPEEKLEVYSSLLRLILTQTITQLSGRKEDRSDDIPVTLMVLDELPRILEASGGAFPKLVSSLKTARSKGVSYFIVSQSIEALQAIYGKDTTQDIISNILWIYFLSCNSPDTMDFITKMTGKYYAKSRSWSGSGQQKRTNFSFTEKNVYEGSDLQELMLSGTGILITPYGWCRPSKCFYYSDKFFKKLEKKLHEKMEVTK